MRKLYESETDALRNATDSGMGPRFGVFPVFWGWVRRIDECHFSGFQKVRHVVPTFELPDARVVSGGLQVELIDGDARRRRA